MTICQKKPELLAPAGNMEKLEAAIRYGADAVYLAGNRFGMRAGADNFAPDELRTAIDYAHRHGVRVYLTVNTMPREDEYPALREYFASLRDMPPDALIIADIGVLSVAREMLPDLAVHLSTQANAVSAAACRAWQALGVSRIVLARELTLREIRAIRSAIPEDLELEAFVHGSMCISYSGRCLLSGFFTGRDANRGQCTQPCRWNYTLSTRSFEITEEKRPDAPLPIEEVQGETFIMSSKDTCMIEHIPELMTSGIDSFKIEGRMKSAYYTAVVTNAYRMAIDSYSAKNYVYNPAWSKELDSVSHREYGTGYYFAECGTVPNTCRNSGYLKEKAYLALVLDYHEQTGRALLVQRNKFAIGDRVELLTPGQVGRPFVCRALYDESGQPISSTPHPQMRFWAETPFPVHPGDILRAADA